jgi:hypothetical protein
VLVIVVVSLVSGCRSLLGLDEPVARDSAPDTPCGWPFAPIHFDACAIAAPVDPPVFASGTYVIDTDTNEVRDKDGNVVSLQGEVRGMTLLLSISELAIPAGVSVQVTGTRGLIVASWGTVTIAGTLDAGSDSIRPGAGANPPACADNVAGAGHSASGGGSGGGGGGFGGAGGDGGSGGLGTAIGGLGGVAVLVPLDIRGGCPGAAGGKSTMAVGGAGGGAIQLTARASITIDGVIATAGAGGAGGVGDGGGGGGGAGGLIDLDAPSITLGDLAVLAANGGGGGGGSRTTVPGMAGQAGRASGTAAAGGIGSTGSDGGAGSSMVVLDGRVGVDGGDGGGAGGGGAGFVVVHQSAGAMLAGVVSPRGTLE